MAEKKIINKNLLYEKYILEKKSIRKVSKELGCSTETIIKNLKTYSLLRTKSEAQKVKCENEGVHNQFELNLELVKKLYLVDKLTTYDIAKELKCSQYKVWKTLKKHNLTRSVSESGLGRQVWNKGKIGVQKHSDETIRKIRVKTLERLEQTKLKGCKLYPAYNSKSIPFIEKYSNEHGYKIQHAENGGEFHIKELGYWVDGYDKEKNVVIEYDENYHNRQKLKDVVRQNEIINYLKCTFIRLNENGEEILKIK
jgi:hypothetical protein